MTLDEAIIGRKVVYTPKGSRPNKVHDKGVITYVSLKFIMVRYGNDMAAKATYPEDLEYI